MSIYILNIVTLLRQVTSRPTDISANPDQLTRVEKIESNLVHVTPNPLVYGPLTWVGKTGQFWFTLHRNYENLCKCVGMSKKFPYLGLVDQNPSKYGY